jgi:hypothetical protein
MVRNVDIAAARAENPRIDMARSGQQTGDPSPHGAAPTSPRLLLLAAALALGVLWRLDGAGEEPLFGDEHHTLRLIGEGYRSILATYDMVGSHVALPLLQRASTQVFGPGLWSFRLPAVLGGILGLLLCYPTARRLVGPVPAALATAALAASPMHVYYSRFARAYALVVMLGLLLVLAVEAATRPRAGRARRTMFAWSGVTITAALLPFCHLSSLGFVGGVALATLCSCYWTPSLGFGARPRAVLASFGLAGVLLVAFYLPVWQSVLEFMTTKADMPSPGPVGVIDVATLLAGGRAAGLAILVLVPVAAGVMLRRRAWPACLLVAAIAGPVVGLLASRPYGMAYAYARYAIAVLPFVLMLVAWLFVEAVRRVLSPPRADLVALGLGVLAIGAGYLAGPLAVPGPDDRPFSNTYLALHRLAAFDHPYAASPRFYETLAGEDVRRIIEVPPLVSRAVLLYRNYRLQHGKDVSIGLLVDDVPTLRGGPYVSLRDLLRGETPGADYLVVHVDVAEELAGYWDFVYDQVWPQIGRSADEPFMLRHKTYRAQEYQDLAPLVEVIGRTLGPPAYDDGRIVAWRLGSPAGRGGGG